MRVFLLLAVLGLAGDRPDPRSILRDSRGLTQESRDGRLEFKSKPLWFTPRVEVKGVSLDQKNPKVVKPGPRPIPGYALRRKRISSLPLQPSEPVQILIWNNSKGVYEWVSTQWNNINVVKAPPPPPKPKAIPWGPKVEATPHIAIQSAACYPDPVGLHMVAIPEGTMVVSTGQSIRDDTGLKIQVEYAHGPAVRTCFVKPSHLEKFLDPTSHMATHDQDLYQAEDRQSLLRAWAPAGRRGVQSAWSMLKDLDNGEFFEEGRGRDLGRIVLKDDVDPKTFFRRTGLPISYTEWPDKTTYYLDLSLLGGVEEYHSHGKPCEDCVKQPAKPKKDVENLIKSIARSSDYYCNCNVGKRTQGIGEDDNRFNVALKKAAKELGHPLIDAAFLKAVLHIESTFKVQENKGEKQVYSSLKAKKKKTAWDKWMVEYRWGRGWGQFGANNAAQYGVAWYESDAEYNSLNPDDRQSSSSLRAKCASGQWRYCTVEDGLPHVMDEENEDSQVANIKAIGRHLQESERDLKKYFDWKNMGEDDRRRIMIAAYNRGNKRVKYSALAYAKTKGKKPKTYKEILMQAPVDTLMVDGELKEDISTSSFLSRHPLGQCHVWKVFGICGPGQGTYAQFKDRLKLAAIFGVPLWALEGGGHSPSQTMAPEF